MTSLTGFEALLRGKKKSAATACLFYAGWGLTKICFPFRAAAAGPSFGS